MQNKKRGKKIQKKAKKTKAKPVKKISQELVIRVAPQTPTVEDLKPIETNSGKLMIPPTWISDKQVLKMVQETPVQHVYTRPGKGGKQWSYVTGNYVEKVLNYVFGWNWDFEVVSHGREQDQIFVLGKLTVKDNKGNSISKSQFGRKEIAFKKNSKEMLDYGNDLKSATTDALKKCASLLGIASDIYGKNEFKSDAGVELPEKPTSETLQYVPEPQKEPKRGQVIGPDGAPTYICSVCDAPVRDAGAELSKKIHGKVLCREHYNEANAKKK